ncbi:MAG TPA: hypothetical protein V6D23_11790, partial [Candidatus Obscuribacterales bacterium]
SYAQGYTQRDNGFYQAWDAISRDRQRFRDWIDCHILATPDFQSFQARLAGEDNRDSLNPLNPKSCHSALDAESRENLPLGSTQIPARGPE